MRYWDLESPAAVTHSLGVLGTLRLGGLVGSGDPEGSEGSEDVDMIIAFFDQEVYVNVI